MVPPYRTSMICACIHRAMGSNVATVMALHASAKVGRNEPCPCGSGKKYKHCCLPGYAPSIDHVWARQHEESDRLTREITRFALRKFGDRIDEAWQDFNLRDVPKPLGEAADERQIFMPYFLFQWNPRARAGRRCGSLVHAGEVEAADRDGTDVFGAGHNTAAKLLRGGLERTR